MMILPNDGDGYGRPSDPIAAAKAAKRAAWLRLPKFIRVLLKRMKGRYPNPVPQEFQRRARMRRLAQQLRDCCIDFHEFSDAASEVEADYTKYCQVRRAP